MRNLDLFLAFAFQATILDEPVYWTSGVGAACTLVGSLILGIVKIRSKKKQTSVLIDEVVQPATIIELSKA